MSPTGCRCKCILFDIDCEGRWPTMVLSRCCVALGSLLHGSASGCLVGWFPGQTTMPPCQMMGCDRLCAQADLPVGGYSRHTPRLSRMSKNAMMHPRQTRENSTRWRMVGNNNECSSFRCGDSHDGCEAKVSCSSLASDQASRLVTVLAYTFGKMTWSRN